MMMLCASLGASHATRAPQRSRRTRGSGPSSLVIGRGAIARSADHPTRGPDARPAVVGTPPLRPLRVPCRAGLSVGGPTDGLPVSPAGSPPSSPRCSVETTDFLVLGSGIAGLSYALAVAEHGSVAVVTKAAADDGCTRYAQGGICAVLDPRDSVAAHVHDTMVAGAWLNCPEAVAAVCAEGPALVLGLARLGAEFTRAAVPAGRGRGGGLGGARAASASPLPPLHLTREGGHSARRVVHAADATGAEIERALLARARAHPAITFHEHRVGADLVLGELPGGGRACLGADTLDALTGRRTRFLALSTMLATGGAGQLYPVTTNPGVATGDGMAMAARAGAPLEGLEFVQFHPTALVAGEPAAADGRAFLISEAVRGEGGRLLNAAGERFMARYDAARMELAPRDVVARAIHAEMAAAGADHVLLDVRHLGRPAIEAHFPTIAARCAAMGLDMAAAPLPVAPAQHYMCGGVRAGLGGETALPGLWAAGEVASSGLHGANRLASNSLLEGLVFAARAVAPSAAHAARAAAGAAPALAALREEFLSAGRRARAAEAERLARDGPAVAAEADSAAERDAAATRARLRALMWRCAGIVRREADMREGLEEVAALRAEADAGVAATPRPGRAALELRNLAAVGEGVLRAALARRESRGGHYCVDFPEAEVAGPGAAAGERGPRGRPAPPPKKALRAPLFPPAPVAAKKSPRGELARRRSAET
ncbi:LASPO1 [Auxenochlorella protothecoides x Auxenochlorella symbiontica]